MREIIKARAKGISAKKYKYNKTLSLADKVKLNSVWEVIYALNLKEGDER